MNNEIVVPAAELLAGIKDDFSSLWSVKKRGETFEFITPYVMLSGDAISVFVTRRDNGFVISDGGAVDCIADEQGVDVDSRKGLHYDELREKFLVSTTTRQSTGRILCYKITRDVKLVSSYVYDIVHFVESVANSIWMDTLFSAKESDESKFFAKKVNDILQRKVKQLSTDTNKFEVVRTEEVRLCKFDSGIRRIGHDEMWLGMSISKSNLANYQRAVFKAEFGYHYVRDFIPNTRLHLASIADVLPESLRANKNIPILDKAMSRWATELAVTNMTMIDVQNITSMNALFAAA